MSAEKYGYSIQKTARTKPLDLRANGNDPRAMLYRGTKQPVLVDGALDAGRGLPLFTFSPSGVHPFVRAVMAALENGDEKRAIRRVLQEYYEVFRPRSAAELYGLSPEDVPRLANEPPWAALLPWDEETIELWRADIQASVLRENRRFGRELTVSEGWAWCGPTSPEKLDIETDRLHAIMSAIRQRGLRRDDHADGDISVVVLMRRDGQWRWQARTGQHRAAVAGALRFTTLPLRVEKIVNRHDVDIWPNVVSGIFSRDAALQLFDRIFDGHYPPVAQSWASAVSRMSEL